MPGQVPWIPAGPARAMALLTFSRSDWILLHGCIPCLLLGTLWLMAAEYRRNERRRLAKNNPVPIPDRLKSYPPVRLVVPLRGVREHSVLNLGSILGQTYGGSIEWIFVVDSDQDPAGALVRRLVDGLPKDAPAKHATRVIVAGEASATSQKIHNLLAGIGVEPAPTVAADGYVLCLDDDVRLPDTALALLVDSMRGRHRAFMCTGYPFDIPPPDGTDTVASYAALSYHLPLLIGFSVAEQTSFVWGGCMLFHASTFDADKDPTGLLAAWRDGGYSDDLAAAAVCAARGLTILCPAHAVFLQPMSAYSRGLADAWGYLRRQLVVLDLYDGPSTRRTHAALALAHCYWSLALVAPCAVLLWRVATRVTAAIARLDGSAAVASSMSASIAAHHSPLALLALLLAWTYAWWGLRAVISDTLALCEARDDSLQPGALNARFHPLKLALGFIVNNAMVPLCLAVTFWKPTVEWSGITYARKNGKVVHVQHPV